MLETKKKEKEMEKKEKKRKSVGKNNDRMIGIKG